GHLYPDELPGGRALRLARPAHARERTGMTRFLARRGPGSAAPPIPSLVILPAVPAPLLVRHDPLQSDLAAGLKPPGSPGHPLGTDQLGRDLLARVLHGARVGLLDTPCVL